MYKAIDPAEVERYTRDYELSDGFCRPLNKITPAQMLQMKLTEFRARREDGRPITEEERNDFYGLAIFVLNGGTREQLDAMQLEAMKRHL